MKNDDDEVLFDIFTLTVSTALLFFPLIDWWLADCQLLNEKVFILCCGAGKMFDFWAVADCLTSCYAMRTYRSLAGGMKQSGHLSKQYKIV